MKKTILIITGPTASGKTGLAIECAKRFNGEIISCDSMQIYKHLNIGTAKATEEEQSQVKHHLIDVVSPEEEFSVQEYVKLAKEHIDDIISRNKLPIIAGGTGLYIKSLIYPYSFCGAPKNEEIRKKYQNILQTNGKEFLYEILKQKDFDASKRIHINDTKRVIRALEIFDSTGIEKTKLNSKELKPLYNTVFVVLNPDDRDVLYTKINQSMQAIGYKELFDLEDNKTTELGTRELIKKNSRN